MISPSGALAETLKDVGLASPVGVVPNAIDTDFFRPIENDSEKENAKRHFGINGFSIAYMGRLGYEKSIDVVIRAFAYMKKEMPDLTLMIIGDGPERRHLEQLVRELGLTDSVVFTGFQYGEDLVRALHANDVFVTASKSENMPLSVLEAMAVGLPVISVREKGLAEIVKEGENGLFSKTDDEQDIATKTLSILSRPDTMREYGVASRKLALQYSEDVAVEALLDAYNRALKNQT
jgi:1,2-diacylglycerol 3-alpha-glucosyltransferase